MTAPTSGFGLVCPRALAAKVNARRINFSFADVRPALSVKNNSYIVVLNCFYKQKKPKDRSSGGRIPCVFSHPDSYRRLWSFTKSASDVSEARGLYRR